MPEVAMAFVTLRESWRALVPMKRRESLAQVRLPRFLSFYEIASTILIAIYKINKNEYP